VEVEVEVIPVSLAEAAENHLADYGIRIPRGLSQLTWLTPQPITLSVDGRLIEVGAMYLPHMSATDALRAANAAAPNGPLLVIGPRIHESSAVTFRARGIWYVDESGNAYLRQQALVVDVRGRRGGTSTSQDRHLEVGPTNPFTPKRAQVGLALLSSPGLAAAPFREIADRAGVSLGMAKSTLDTLAIAGFVEQVGSHRRLIRADELLNLWVAAYPGGLAKANTLLVARGEIDNWSPPYGIDFAVSGEQALKGEIRNPATLVLYVHSYVHTDGGRRPPRELMMENRWGRDPHGNIVIRELFWRDLPSFSNVGTAPAVLVYADLIASREPRQIEVAHEMRNEIERLVQR
jgi:hypothetical protein